MQGGVLIAGSLIWDDYPLRKEWRSKRLKMEARESVRAPIRYGRCSSSRSDTYTMVFSTSCVDEGLATGTGIVVPFKSQLRDFGDVVCEATELWRVERKANSEARGVVSARWGAVGLLINPHPNSNLTEELSTGWSQLAQVSPHYRSVSTNKVEGEAAAVDGTTGQAGFSWNCLAPDGGVADLDILLFTATAPTLKNGQYPTVEMISRAWRSAPLEAKYFRRNREWGITTHADGEIEELLGDVLDLC